MFKLGSSRSENIGLMFCLSGEQESDLLFEQLHPKGLAQDRYSKNNCGKEDGREEGGKKEGICLQYCLHVESGIFPTSVGD